MTNKQKFIEGQKRLIKEKYTEGKSIDTVYSIINKRIEYFEAKNTELSKLDTLTERQKKEVFAYRKIISELSYIQILIKNKSHE